MTIEVTDEMVQAYDDAAWNVPIESLGMAFANVPAGLDAVFAIIEREHEVRRLTPTVGREHASADEYGIDDGRPDGPGELVRW